MTSLIACIGTDPKTWEYIDRLINGAAWESVYLLAAHGVAYSPSKPANIITIDTKQPLQSVIGEIKTRLDGKIIDTEVAVNMSLGSGKEHMALISAIIKLGLGIRLVAYTLEGVKEV